MKLRFALSAALLLLGARFAAAQSAAGAAAVEFAGYIQTATEMRFVLTDPAAKRTSDWLAVGGSFSGYKIVGYDTRTETLAVEKDGVTTRLRLKGAGTIAPPWWVTWDRADVSQLTEAQKLILRFEDSVVSSSDKPDLNAQWQDYYFDQLNQVKSRKRLVREAAAAGQPIPKNLSPVSDYSELLRHMLGWLHEKKRTLGPDVRNRRGVLERLDELVVQTEKELAN